MNFDIMDNLIITSSESKDNLVRTGTGLITYMCLKDKASPNRYKLASYAIRNVSKKEPSKIIRDFEKLPYKSYDKMRPNHEPTDS